jgi:hypothetical protein
MNIITEYNDVMTKITKIAFIFPLSLSPNST